MPRLLYRRLFRLALSAAVPLLPLAGTPAQAHLPAAYSMEYLRADHFPDRSLPSELNHPVTVDGDLALYQSALEQIERREGPYAAGMTEPLNAMAQLYMKEENFAEAIEFFDRAIHIERINTGLNNDGLIPLLEHRLIGYQQLGDLRGVEQTHESLYRIHGSGTAPFTPDRLAAATRYLDWLRTSVTESDSDSRERELLSLLQETERLLEFYEQSADMKPEQHFALVLSQLRNLYLLQSLAPVTHYTISASNEGMVPITDQHLDVWRRRAINRGAALLRGYLERWPQQAPLDRAAVMLELGDWYQWNDKWRSAGTEYSELVNTLIRSGHEKAIGQWFGAPAELPDDFALSSLTFADQNKAAVTMQFDVSRLGQVRRVEYLDGPEQDGYKIRRMLRETHFRPVFKDGEAVDSERVVRAYRLLEPRLN